MGVFAALLPSIVSGGLGLLGSLFGKSREKYTSTVDLSNPYILKALRRAEDVSRQGMDIDTINRIRQNIVAQTAQEAQGLRTAAEQRLMRQNTPVQVMEQILGDISQGVYGKRLGALTDVDLANERYKQEALRMYMAGAKGLTQKTTQEQPAGLGYGSLLGSALGDISRYFTLKDIFGNQVGAPTSTTSTLPTPTQPRIGGTFLRFTPPKRQTFI